MRFSPADVMRLAARGICPSHPEFHRLLGERTAKRSRDEHALRIRAGTLGRHYKPDGSWESLDEVEDASLRGNFAIYGQVLIGIGRIERFRRGNSLRYILFSRNREESVLVEAWGGALVRVL